MKPYSGVPTEQSGGKPFAYFGADRKGEATGDLQQGQPRAKVPESGTLTVLTGPVQGSGDRRARRIRVVEATAGI